MGHLPAASGFQDPPGLAQLSGSSLLQDRPISEDEWTRLLLKHGYAELAQSEPNIKVAGGTGERKAPPAAANRLAEPLPLTATRRRELRDMAERMTRPKSGAATAAAEDRATQGEAYHAGAG